MTSTAIRAAYHDGRTAEERSVELAPAGPGKVRISGDGVERVVDYDAMRISARLGSSPRYLYLEDGARLETLDNDAVDHMVAAMGDRGWRWLHVLESRLRLALLALVVTAAGIWAAVQYGVPWAAEVVAMSLPVEVLDSVGEQAMASLDAQIFEPSTLTPAEHRRVHALFERARISSGSSERLKLELRSASIGANAFALPNDTVVVTDEMVALAQDDGELLGVIAHEIGHVQMRHGLRQLLQSTATAVLIAALLGDVTAISGLAAAVPTFLVDQSYSRGFEREADEFAVALLEREGISPERFAALLERLGHGEPDSEWMEYLSSHPATDDRAEAARQQN